MPIKSVTGTIIVADMRTDSDLKVRFHSTGNVAFIFPQNVQSIANPDGGSERGYVFDGYTCVKT